MMAFLYEKSLTILNLLKKKTGGAGSGHFAFFIKRSFREGN